MRGIVMNKKTIIILIFIVVLVIIGYYMVFQNNNQVTIDGANFKIPNGYHVIDENNSFNFTNNNNSIIISKRTTGNINKSVDNYMDNKKNANISVKLFKMDLNNKKVYQVTEDNPAVLHYWFEKNGKVYEIGSWDANPNTDYVVKELIQSTDSII